VFARVKKSRHEQYLQIVENYREGGKVRQRMVLYVGHYGSIEEALRLMPQELRRWRRRRSGIGDNEFRQKEAEYLHRVIESTDKRLGALRRLVADHPDMVERDRERAERHRRRQAEARRAWLEAGAVW